MYLHQIVPESLKNLSNILIYPKKMLRIDHIILKAQIRPKMAIQIVIDGFSAPPGMPVRGGRVIGVVVGPWVVGFVPKNFK